LAHPALSRPVALNAAAAGERRLAVAVGVGWALVAGAVAVALKLAAAAPQTITAAVALMAAPGLASLLLWAVDNGGVRKLLLLLWAAAGAGACALAGGISGPLAAWCLAPVAAAALLGPRRLMAEAAALAVLGAALAALAQAAGLEPAPPSEPLRFALALMALASFGFALACGLVRPSRAGVGAGQLEVLLTQQPQLILALDAAGAVESAYGYPPPGVDEAALARGLKGLLSSADWPALARAMDSAARGMPAELIGASAADGETVLAITLRAASDGRLYGAVRDATLQRLHEDRLIAAKAEAEALNTGKSRFLANMSHELRTPLNTIMGFSDIMKARLFGPMPAKYGEYAELIHESGRHLLDLINDLLDMSKIEAERFQLHIEELDARDPVSAALRLMRSQAESAGLSLRASLPPEPLDVEADPRALKQISLNLISNAVKFTPRGGQVTVTLTGEAEGMVLTVADTGVGIASEDIARLGRPFEQAGDAGQRARGTGLGLSLVRGLSELHGGQMIIESTLGEGTSVTVRLPGVAAVRADPDLPSAQVIAFSAGRKA
jgi:cell cycle sensor histidine kinase DivJ